PSQVGSLNYKSRIAKDGETSAGYLIYGPYVLLLTGKYEATLEYESGNPATTPAPQFDIVYDTGRSVVGRANLPPSNTNGGKFKYAFSVDDATSMKKPFELRVWYPGSGAL